MKKCGTCHGQGNVLEEFTWATAGSGSFRGPISNKGFRQDSRRGPRDRNDRGGRDRNDRGGERGDRRPGGDRQAASLPKPGMQSVRQYVTPGGHHTPLRENFLQQSQKAAAVQEKEVNKDLSLKELYDLRLMKRLSIQFAREAKFSFLPLPANQTLVRFNPKINDVFTLVDAMTGMASGMMPGMALGGEEEFEGIEEEADYVAEGELVVEDAAEAEGITTEDESEDQAAEPEESEESEEGDDDEVPLAAVAAAGLEDEIFDAEPIGDDDDDDDGPGPIPQTAALFGEDLADIEPLEDDEDSEGDEDADEEVATAAAPPRGGRSTSGRGAAGRSRASNNRPRRGRPPKRAPKDSEPVTIDT